MTRLFSYVVDHDFGYAPDPFGGYCSLVQCKFSKTGKRKNIVELAEVGDWILGTGGKGPNTAGNGKIIYIMRVDEKLTLSDYYNDPRYQGRTDQTKTSRFNERYALISKTYFYFGKNAIEITSLPKKLRRIPIENRGRGYQYKNFNQAYINALTRWFLNKFKKGVHGSPCRKIGSVDLSIRWKCVKGNKGDGSIFDKKENYFSNNSIQRTGSAAYGVGPSR